MVGGSRALTRILVAALILSCSAAATGQSAPPSVPPIPVFEQFVHGTNLRIRLTMRSTSLTAFEEPGFTAIFENTDSVPLYLNPDVVSNLRVFDERGNLMQPPCVSISEPGGPAVIGRADLVRLPAGGTWVKPLRPAFASGGPGSVWTYWGCGRQREQERLLLPRGSYTARFTYLSYVGYAFGYVPGRAAGDDLRESADVWEGRLDAEPLAFSVAGALEVASEPWPGVRLTDGATDEPWPHMAGDIAFLKRELNHRDLWICVRALEALNKLTGQSLVFDFRIPSERKRAIEAFAATQ